MDRTSKFQFLTLTTLILAGLMTTACGGGSSGGGGVVTPPVTTATFAPTAPPGDISMALGGQNGLNFEIVINLANVPSFNSAAFNVSYDSAAFTFVGLDSSGSFLPGSAIFDATDTGTGQITVVAAMPAGANVGSPNGELLRLMLRGVSAATNSAVAVLTNAQTAPVVSRQVLSCTSPTTCTDVESTLTYTGGTASAS